MLRATPVPLILIETIIKPLTLKYSIKSEDVLDFGGNFDQERRTFKQHHSFLFQRVATTQLCFSKASATALD
jgi:hypothetical protein